MTVAVFGGSFDPPHVGHVLAVHYVLSVAWVDTVVVVPVFEHAFRKRSESFEDRLALCEAAFGGIPHASVNPIERDLSAPSYTLQTVRALAEALPGANFRLLMGADLLPDVSKWHRFDELRNLAPPLVLGRAGVAESSAPPAVLPEISSSDVRGWLRERQKAPARQALEAYVPRAVLDLIERKGLYW